MKKLLVLVVLIISCNCSTKLVNKSKLGVFEIENIEGNTILLSKRETTLKNNDEIKIEHPYKLRVPSTLIEIKSTITVIPNRNELLFDDNQKVLIFENKKKQVLHKTNLKKDDFLSELYNNKLSNFINNQQLYKSRYFGIYTHKNYVIVYLNVKEKNISIFNDILKSVTW
jgi:hypothetical protein